MLRRVKTAVMVSGSGSNLQALIDALADGRMPNVELSLVVSSKQNSYALQRAGQNGIASAVVERRIFGGDSLAFENELLFHLEKYEIEFIILAGFLTIFTSSFTDRFKDRIINVHPALIPSFSGKGFYGLKVHEAALERGVKVSGATVHYVNEAVDAGRIILQKAVEVLDGDTPQTLQQRVLKAEHILLPRAAQMAAEIIAKEKP